MCKKIKVIPLKGQKQIEVKRRRVGRGEVKGKREEGETHTTHHTHTYTHTQLPI